MPARKKQSHEDLKEHARKLIRILKREYPDARCALNHAGPFELLIATILSAQCTDERVNIVTADLFRKYRKPADYLKAPTAELERDIRPTGFYRNKARSIQGAARLIHERFGDEVPQTIDELLALPGVARKTANVVLGNSFGKPDGVVVDTHVLRLSQRLALTEEKTPEKIERDLNELVPKKDWTLFPHLLISHGRKVCKAIRPLCAQCVLEPLCPSSTLRTGPSAVTGAKPAR
ncbi:MAG TPA: endonuclease III [Blastocatellia bacterium]|nr:endonuclease III [Blastocatellia bacterium]